ncbi:unnamed protein product [Calicophoron daubneyi]|uniref:Uncharacterized protein n=1 Tax=Calicophoron daubneyi TaxID=300641 RepID=A0AAV2TDH3_CALDB
MPKWQLFKVQCTWFERGRMWKQKNIREWILCKMRSRNRTLPTLSALSPLRHPEKLLQAELSTTQKPVQIATVINLRGGVQEEQKFLVNKEFPNSGRSASEDGSVVIVRNPTVEDDSRGAILGTVLGIAIHPDAIVIEAVSSAIAVVDTAATPPVTTTGKIGGATIGPPPLHLLKMIMAIVIIQIAVPPYMVTRGLLVQYMAYRSMLIAIWLDRRRINRRIARKPRRQSRPIQSQRQLSQYLPLRSHQVPSVLPQLQTLFLV